MIELGINFPVSSIFDHLTKESTTKLIIQALLICGHVYQAAGNVAQIHEYDTHGYNIQLFGDVHIVKKGRISLTEVLRLWYNKLILHMALGSKIINPKVC